MLFFGLMALGVIRHELVEYGHTSDDYVVLEYGTTKWNRFLKEEGYAEQGKDK